MSAQAAARPFNVRDGKGLVVQHFATFAQAEAYAGTWAREKMAGVPVFFQATHIATAQPVSARGIAIDLTAAGCRFA